MWKKYEKIKFQIAALAQKQQSPTQDITCLYHYYSEQKTESLLLIFEHTPFELTIFFFSRFKYMLAYTFSIMFLREHLFAFPLLQHLSDMRLFHGCFIFCVSERKTNAKWYPEDLLLFDTRIHIARAQIFTFVQAYKQNAHGLHISAYKKRQINE